MLDIIHDEMSQLLKSQWVLQEHGVLESCVLNYQVPEIVVLLHFFLVDQAVAYSDDSLLDVHGQVDAILEPIDMLALEVK